MGKLRNRKPIDMLGYEFQTWKVIAISDKKSSGNNQYWLCECQKCGQQKELCGSEIRLSRTGACKCLKKKVEVTQQYYLTEDSSSTKIKNEIGHKYGRLTVISFAYTKDSNAYWNCQCDCGKITIVRGNALRTGSILSCGCLVSRKEEEISVILNSNHIDYKRQFTFSDLRDKGLLRFDFAIFKDGVLLGLVEYQGSQHYELNDSFSNNGLLQLHDDMKKEYCQEHNIPLLELNKDNNLEKDLLFWLNQIGE